MLHVGDTSCLEPGGCGLLPWGLIKDYACEMNGSPPLGLVENSLCIISISYTGALTDLRTMKFYLTISL